MVDTGPPYPPALGPGSNAIGSFEIGVSPIGTISAFNVWATIIAQYSNSPIIVGMITAFNEAMDMTENLDDFYDLIWNVLTAEGYGLEVWGRIVGVSRTVAVGSGPTGTFGFNEPGNDWVGFGQGPFTSGVSPTSNVTLNDTQFRQLILAKAATNIWDGSIEGMNSILLALFAGRGASPVAYVADGLDMSITLTFSFPLQPLDLAIIQTAGVLPNPTGVIIKTSYP